MPSVPSRYRGNCCPPRGHLFVFCEDGLVMRLSFMLVCIFYKCLDQTFNKSPILMGHGGSHLQSQHWGVGVGWGW